MATTTQHTFCLPDVGEGLVEAEVVNWLVGPGDDVLVNQPIVEIETAKSLVELPSPCAGRVAEIAVPAGATAAVGAPIIVFDLAPDAVAHVPATDPAQAPAHEAGVVAADETPANLVGYGVKELGTARRRRRASGMAPAPTAPDVASLTSTGPGETSKTQTVIDVTEPASRDALVRPRTKPPVRKLAKELGVDLAAVTPSGPDGIILRADVLEAANGRAGSGLATNGLATNGHTPGGGVVGPAGSSQAAAAQRQTPGVETRIPIKGVRKHTAEAVSASAFTAPHVTEFVTVDITRTLELRESIQQRPEFAGVKLSPLVFVARAYLRALARTPMATARWDEPNQEIVIPAGINLGIAAATPRGLVVPNIKDAHTLDLLALTTAINELAETARAGKTTPEAMAGGTSTITNLGVFGVDIGTPILNPGETAILAVGAIRRQPWVVGTGDDERIEPRSVVQLALSFDHRVLDGQQGSAVLADTAAVLAEPGLALL